MSWLSFSQRRNGLRSFSRRLATLAKDVVGGSASDWGFPWYAPDGFQGDAPLDVFGDGDAQDFDRASLRSLACHC
jgi:hypothetical protein